MPRGKCDQCSVRWNWNGRPRIRDAICPSCHRPLQPTSLTSLLKLYGAYAVTGFNGGPRRLTADPTEISKLRRDLKKRLVNARANGFLKRSRVSGPA